MLYLMFKINYFLTSKKICHAFSYFEDIELNLFFLQSILILVTFHHKTEQNQINKNYFAGTSMKNE